MKKPAERKGKIIFIDAKDELRIDRNSAWLEPQHIKKISEAYWKLKNAEGFAKVLTNKAVLENNGNLNLQLYVQKIKVNKEHKIEDLIDRVKTGQKNTNSSIEKLFNELKSIGVKI